jgi:hypothetical protein
VRFLYIELAVFQELHNKNEVFVFQSNGKKIVLVFFVLLRADRVAFDF